MNRFWILASIFIVMSCADEGKTKKKKSASANQIPQEQPQQYNSGNSQPGNSDGLLGSVQDSSKNSNGTNKSAQGNSSDMLSQLLGGLGGGGGNNPLAGLLQQFMGQGGMDPSQLQGMMSGAGGFDINKIMTMLPQLQGMDLNALMGQMQQGASLHAAYADPAPLALADLLGSAVVEDGKGINNGRYISIGVECLSDEDSERVISVLLKGGSQTFFGTRALSCSEFRIVFPGLIDGDYKLQVSLKNLKDNVQKNVGLNVRAVNGKILDKLEL